MRKILVERDCEEIYCDMCESQVRTRRAKKYGPHKGDRHAIYVCGEFYDNHEEIRLEFDLEKLKNKRCQQCLDAERSDNEHN